MFKGRTSVLIIVGIIIVVVLYLLLFSGTKLTGPAKSALPVDLQKIIPTKWTPDQLKTCDFDGDGEDEWLIAYHYDAGTIPGRSLIGGVIYDAQVNRVPQAPGNESPYRPAFLVPYKLLPDFYTGKGQGYLGETSVKVNIFPPEQNGKACRAQEITVQGFSDTAWPTRLSIFRWGGDTIGYPDVHFVADLRIVAGDGTVPITDVVTYNRLNDRSALCSVQRYTRPAAADPKTLPPGIAFAEDGAAYTMDFCFGAPDDAAYPEGVVTALLRGNTPKSKDNNLSPTGESYLTANAILPAELARLRGSKPTPLRVLAVTNEGALNLYPDNGQTCNPASLAPATPAAGTPTPTIWWCGRERATVVTEIILDGQHRIATWHLLSIASDQINADVLWRIESAELR